MTSDFLHFQGVSNPSPFYLLSLQLANSTFFLWKLILLNYLNILFLWWDVSVYLRNSRACWWVILFRFCNFQTPCDLWEFQQVCQHPHFIFRYYYVAYSLLHGTSISTRVSIPITALYKLCITYKLILN